MTDEIVQTKTGAVAPTGVTNAFALMEAALAKGADVEALERIQAMCEREQDRSAAREFNESLAHFQSSIEEVAKTRTAKVTTKGGSSYTYAYADLSDITRSIRPHLAPHGLSYTWDTSIDGNVMTVECIVRHTNGHSVTSKAAVPLETQSGMSSQQRMGNAQTYGMRYSLGAALGITVALPDNDAQATKRAPKLLSIEQLGELTNRMNACGADQERFAAALGVAGLDDLTQDDLTRANNALAAKERQNARKGDA